ncbi:protein FAM170B-like [Trichechus manatus latirostris]|uniref:Protein FAM170B-like n=1 Tax=Trichechus manatus latirostris TaxID=127582 RepID=A0A2Y9RV48_TRIMA|nr:protein FAM170B-like [Trichechus manatus latirostris]
MERQYGGKRPFSKTREVSTQEEHTTQPKTSAAKSPSSRPRKIPRQSERSFSSPSTEQTSHSSSYEAAPEKRWVRCAYFTQVRTVKGVAVAWRTKTSFAPVDKMPQVFEAELSEESTIGSAPSLANTESLVSALEPWQEGPEARTPEPSVHREEHGERSRATTPEWLVTCKRGFRCVACCRVFQSREALVAHAEHGVSQGFSCRVYYEELLERRLPPSAQRRSRRCHQLARRCLMAAKKREVREKRAVCRRLEEQLEKQREELRRLRHQLERLERQEARLQRAQAQHQGQRGKRQKTR